MNIKKALAIGLLTTAIIGLGACAIAFNKKQKTTKTNAIDYNSAIYDSDILTIAGNPQNYTSVTFSGATSVGEYTAPQSAEPGDVVLPGYSLEYSYKITNDHLAKVQPTYKLGYVDQKEINVEFQMPTRDIEDPIEEIEEINLNQTKWWIERTSVIGRRIYLGLTYYVISNNYMDMFYDEIIYEYNLQMNEHMSYWTAPDNNEYANIGQIEYIQNKINSAVDYATYSYQTGLSEGTTYGEVVDVRGIMFDVLSMPFTFISQAFDVTLWEGTQYAINISNFIKGLIAIATILFILKLFTSGMAVISNYTGTTSEKVGHKLTERVNKSREKRDKKVERTMNEGFYRD